MKTIHFSEELKQAKKICIDIKKYMQWVELIEKGNSIYKNVYRLLKYKGNKLDYNKLTTLKIKLLSYKNWEKIIIKTNNSDLERNEKEIFDALKQTIENGKDPSKLYNWDQKEYYKLEQYYEEYRINWYNNLHFRK